MGLTALQGSLPPDNQRAGVMVQSKIGFKFYSLYVNLLGQGARTCS